MIRVDYAVKLIHVKLGPPTWIYDVGLIKRYRQVMLVSMGYSYLCHFLVLCRCVPESAGTGGSFTGMLKRCLYKLEKSVLVL